jgi:fructose-1,6-bisphosphatase
MENEKNYLEYLAELYPTIEKAATEIINLQSVINLPKGTEHFLSDIHGEYEAFSHVLRNGSGAVRKKIDDVFGHTLGISEKRALATLIYYPRERLEMEKKQQEDIDDWYKVMLYRLIDVCKIVSSKYTRAKVRKALPADYGYIIEELITEKPEVLDKEAYYEAIIQTILEIGSAENFIIAVAELIQRLVVDHLHIIGDIFDRGPEPYKIMDCLMNYHSLDIQWGNHDVLWMGAATGQPACVASTIRICLHYGNLDVLEDGYGINMLPLATFALETYGDDPCECFAAKGGENKNITDYGDSLQRKFLVVDAQQFIHSKKLTDYFFFVELDTDKRVFGYPFIGQCQIGNFLQTFHITDNGILLTFLFRLQIKFKGTYQLTVDFRQRQIILSVFLSDKFGKIALAAFITANGNQGVVFPD